MKSNQVLSLENAQVDTTPTGGRLLQRACACGQHTAAGGECQGCKKKRVGLQRLQRKRDKGEGQYTLSNLRAVEPKPFQAKLQINEPGDVYEQEADRVVDRIMCMPEPAQQRQSEPGNGKDHLQFGSLVQCQVNGRESDRETPPIVHDVLRSGGQPLDPVTREFMETRFGHDFSRVRVHTGNRAAESAQAVNARAYTVGENIVFGQRSYSPQTDMGKKLLAHELTHVVQQSDATNTPTIQRWSYGAGSHNTSGGNTFREFTNDEREGSNGIDAAMTIVERLVNGTNWRARTCQQWFTDNCDVARSLSDLQNRAVLWMWREADGSGGLGLTDGGARQHHAVTEQLFNRRSRWALAATIIHEYWHDCETRADDIGDDAKQACGLPNI